MVAKRKDSIYEQGLRTGSWLKIKNLKTCDCVIFGYSRREDARESTLGTLVVGLYDQEGKPVYVAHVGTGFTQQLLDSLTPEFKKIKIDVAPFRVRGMEGVTWLEPKLVCEVIYQVLTRDCRLRMLRLHTLRFDKNPADPISKLDTIKEMIRALGENPEQLLSREALSMCNISAAGDIENHQLSVLSLQLRDILRKATEA